MARNSRRHSTGFGYIGFGNNQKLFNQSSRKAFGNLKEKLVNETHLHFQLDFHSEKLSKAKKEAIKNKIRKDEARKTQKTILAFIIISIPVFFFFKFLIDQLSENL